jgi:hypothetical protein
MHLAVSFRCRRNEIHIMNEEIEALRRNSRVWDGEILEMYTNTGYKSSIIYT